MKLCNFSTFNFSSLKTKLYLSFSLYSFLYPCFYYEFRPTSSNPSLSLSWVGQFMVSIFLTSSKNLLPDSYTLSWQGWLWFDSKWKICAIVNFILIFLPFTLWIWNKKKTTHHHSHKYEDMNTFKKRAYINYCLVANAYT